MQLLLRILGTNFTFLSDKQTNFIVNNNPILLTIALSLFYLFKGFSFKNTSVNAISSLSLYIYLAHENFLFRSITRVSIWNFIRDNYGYTYVVIETLLYSLLLFEISILLSFIFKCTIGRFIDCSVNKHYLNVKNKVEIIFSNIVK